MALTLCHDCGRQISSQASTCPHCGCPLDSTRASTKGPDDTDFPVQVLLTYPGKWFLFDWPWNVLLDSYTRPAQQPERLSGLRAGRQSFTATGTTHGAPLRRLLVLLLASTASCFGILFFIPWVQDVKKIGRGTSIPREVTLGDLVM